MVSNDVNLTNNTYRAVLEAVELLIEQERPIFVNIMQQNDPQTDAGLDVMLTALTEVCQHKTSWGRILVMLAFASYMSTEVNTAYQDLIYVTLRTSLLEQGRWIAEHGGPAKFISFCKGFIRYQRSWRWRTIMNFIRNSFSLSSTPGQQWLLF